MCVQNIANDREKLAKETKGYAVKVNTENMSVKCDGGQAEAVGECRDNDRVWTRSAPSTSKDLFSR